MGSGAVRPEEARLRVDGVSGRVAAWWLVRVYTGFDYSADKRLMRDLLLAPGEVIAIESGWDSGEGPGSTRVGRVRPVKERWDLWLASWRGAEAPSDDEV